MATKKNSENMARDTLNNIVADAVQKSHHSKPLSKPPLPHNPPTILPHNPNTKNKPSKTSKSSKSSSSKTSSKTSLKSSSKLSSKISSSKSSTNHLNQPTLVNDLSSNSNGSNRSNENELEQKENNNSNNRKKIAIKQKENSNDKKKNSDNNNNNNIVNGVRHNFGNGVICNPGSDEDNNPGFPKKYEVQIQARVRVARDLQSQHITDLPEGSVVTVEELVDRRARISRPIAGWLSVKSKFGARIIQPTNKEFQKIGGKVFINNNSRKAEAKVVDYSEQSKLHKIRYDNGNSVWMDLNSPFIEFKPQSNVKNNNKLSVNAPLFDPRNGGQVGFFNQFFCRDFPEYKANHIEKHQVRIDEVSHMNGSNMDHEGMNDGNLTHYGANYAKHGHGPYPYNSHHPYPPNDPNNSNPSSHYASHHHSRNPRIPGPHPPPPHITHPSHPSHHRSGHPSLSRGYPPNHDPMNPHLVNNNGYPISPYMRPQTNGHSPNSHNSNIRQPPIPSHLRSPNQNNYLNSPPNQPKDNSPNHLLPNHVKQLRIDASKLSDAEKILLERENFARKVQEIERRIVQHLRERGYTEKHPDYHRYLKKAKELAVKKAQRSHPMIYGSHNANNNNPSNNTKNNDPHYSSHSHSQQPHPLSSHHSPHNYMPSHLPNDGQTGMSHEDYANYIRDAKAKRAAAAQAAKQQAYEQRRRQMRYEMGAVPHGIPPNPASPNTSPTQTQNQISLQSQSKGQTRSGVKGLIVLRGLPGSGKTTLAKKLVAKSPNARICTEDRYHWSEKQDGVGEYKFQPQLVFLARGWCTKEIRDCIDKNVNLVILDNHNARISMYEDHIQYAVNHGYRFRIIEFVASEELIDRYRARSYKKFPREVYVKLLKLWEHDPRTELINPTFGDLKKDDHNKDDKNKDKEKEKEMLMENDNENDNHNNNNHNNDDEPKTDSTKDNNDEKSKKKNNPNNYSYPPEYNRRPHEQGINLIPNNPSLMEYQQQ